MSNGAAYAHLACLNRMPKQKVGGTATSGLLEGSQPISTNSSEIAAKLHAPLGPCILRDKFEQVNIDNALNLLPICALLVEFNDLLGDYHAGAERREWRWGADRGAAGTAAMD